MLLQGCGNNYINQLSYYNVHSLEVLKGAAGSLYGSGTGCVLLNRSQSEKWNPGMDINYLQGSFHLNSYHAQIRLGQEDRRYLLNYARQNSDGYRHHTQMRRDVASWQTQIKASHHV